jgi:hypothetical protein
MRRLYWLVFILFLAAEIYPQWVRTSLDSLTVNCFAISGTNIFAGTGWFGIGGGVFLSSNDGTSWNAVNEGLPRAWGDTAHYAVVRCCVSSGTNLFAGTNGSGIFISTNNGTSWTAVNSGLTDSNVYAIAVSGTNLFAGTSNGVFFSTNNGTSWTAVNNGLTNTDVNALAVSGANLFAGTRGGVFLSINNGASWTAVNTGLTSTDVLSLAVSGTNLFAGTMVEGVFLSTNNGAGWTQVSAGLPENSNTKALVTYGTNLFAGISNSGGVFLSTNKGTSWTAVNSNLTNHFVNVLAVSGANLFAGTWEYGMREGGVWRRPIGEMIPVELTSFTTSANDKQVTLNWSTATELNNQGFEVQRKFGSNDFVTIGSVRGHGTTTSPNNYNYVDKLVDPGKYFYRLKQIDFGGKYEYSQTVEINWSPFTTYKLEQNFPNPFNPSTVISWQSPVSSWQTLKVYDVLGNEVASLVDEYRSAGNYEVEFKASNLASGIYFYQLKVGEFISVKKMVLIR